jgi:hypothetical protein
MNREEFQQLTTFGVGVAVATRDAQMRPLVSDASGLELLNKGEQALLFVSQKEHNKLLINIQDNGFIAVSISRPTDNLAGQIKGRVTKVRPITTDEKLLVQKKADKYRGEIVLIGVLPIVANSLNMPADLVLEIDVDSLFIQTPGDFAGQPMGAI